MAIATTRSDQMRDKLVLITGGTGGIGLATAQALHERGASLLLTGQNEARGKAVVAGLPRATFLQVNHLSIQSVMRLGLALRNGTVPDVVIHNVGGIFPAREETPEGFEAALALNHLASFALTREIAPVLRPGSRLIFVVSAGHRYVRARSILEDWEAREGRSYSTLGTYNRAKLLSLLCCYEWSRRLAAREVTVNAADPGEARTALTRSAAMPWVFRMAQSLLSPWLTPERAARASVYLASAEEVAGVTGKYYYLEKERKSAPVSYDVKLAGQVWERSETVTAPI